MRVNYDDPCEGCGDGDKVPARGYWKCPICDAEWQDNSIDTDTPAPKNIERS